MRIRLPEPKKYEIILADPPWSFEVWNRDTGNGRSASAHYSTMTFEDLKSLPVGEVAANDCALFLWVTCPSIPDALTVVTSWGFKYKTVGFSWAKETVHGKQHVGMGYWTRANVELCLLCTRGSPKRLSKAVRQLIVAPIGKHSEKPAEIHDRIVQLLGDKPRCELFARKHVPGWDCMGIELSGKDIREELTARIARYPSSGTAESRRS